MIKRISVLGSTGSIGRQTLDVIRQNPDRFKVVALTCGKNTALMAEQIEEFHPRLVVTSAKRDAEALAARFPGSGIAFFSGEDGLERAATCDAEIVLNALVGIAGLAPTYAAVTTGHDVALANKETLVAGGAVIMKEVRKNGVRLLPVDSEHSAIYQCLAGNRRQDLRRIILTASGGPFRGRTREEMAHVTEADALRHPNWKMGPKITIDSATMMNKGFEVIEARWLFDVSTDQIQVVVHPQSIVHSAVEFQDRAILAQMGTPDMRIPISVALGDTERIPNQSEPLDFFGKGRILTFEEPDPENFPCLALALYAAKRGGTYPAVLNAANEVLVAEFLAGRIGFLDIPDLIDTALKAHIVSDASTLNDVFKADAWARRFIWNTLQKGRKL